MLYRLLWYSDSGGQGETADTAGTDMPENKDAQLVITVSEDGMTATAVAHAPQGDGAHLTEADVRSEIKAAGITFGLVEGAAQALCAPNYGAEVVVAKGEPAVNGQDGSFTELFPREVEKQYTMRDDGTMDYKSGGFIRDLDAGTLVCEISLPTKGENGTSVKGQPVKGYDGRPVNPPIGANIKVTEDGLHAKTTVKGNLVFRDEKFSVETQVRVVNVDYKTGNLVFSGDIIVDGDILDGFEVHAGKTVTLKGRGGAVVIEAENIVIEKGINGTGKAVIQAKDTVQSGFIENCIVRAGKKVIATSITNSQVECEGDVDVSGGKGLICGGKVTAFGNVKAREIGNSFNTLTTIVLGVTPKLLKERKKLEESLVNVVAHLEELNKDASYIERLVSTGRPIPQERVQLLKRIQIQLPMSTRKKAQLETQLAQMEDKMRSVNQSTLQANTIYPPTKVSIGTDGTNIMENRNRCRIYKKDGELVIGTM